MRQLPSSSRQRLRSEQPRSVARLRPDIVRSAMMLFVLAAAFANPQTTAVLESKWASEDVALDTDPNSSFWASAPRIVADRDPFGKPVPGHRTEVRSRWTKQNLYLLFICEYQQLNLKPDPKTDQDTYELWKWDVAEAFIGSDFENI